MARDAEESTQGLNPAWGRCLRVPGKRAEPCRTEGRQCDSLGAAGWRELEVVFVRLKLQALGE